MNLKIRYISQLQYNLENVAVVIGYWLLVIGYWLLVIGYWLLVVGGWWFLHQKKRDFFEMIK